MKTVTKSDLTESETVYKPTIIGILREMQELKVYQVILAFFFLSNYKFRL